MVYDLLEAWAYDLLAVQSFENESGAASFFRGSSRPIDRECEDES